MATPNQLWGTNTVGGYMYSDKLSSELRTAIQPTCKFRQFADAKDATKARNNDGQKLGKGDKFYWNVYSDVQTQGGKLNETSTMPVTNFTITQAQMQITEWGNAVDYSSKLDDLSEQPVKEIIDKILRHDAMKAFDAEVYNEFNKTPLRVVAGPTISGTNTTEGVSTSSVVLTTNGTATATNNVSLRRGHVKAIVDMMKERHIPPYVRDDYVCIAHPTTYRPFKDEMETIHQYSDMGFRMIHRSEIGRYEQVRFVEQTHVAKGRAADSSMTAFQADPWNNGESDWAFFFGADTVAEGVVLPEEMRGAIPTDYGRTKGIAWYALLGFGLTQTTETQARVVKWDSAA